jgi:hypothetical protein
MTTDLADLQRPAAEIAYGHELARLTELDGELPRPGGWRLTPRSVLRFVLGDRDLGISPKFVGSRRFVERCVVALATNRGTHADRRAGHGQELPVGAAGRRDLRRLLAHHPGQRGDHRRHHQVLLELRPAAGRGAEREGAGPRPALPRAARRQDRPLRGDHPLPHRGPGLAAQRAQRPGPRHPGAGRRRPQPLRPQGLQRDRDGQHPRRPTPATGASTR